MHCDAILFDMDGVVVDSLPLHYEVTAAVLAAQGRPLTRELYNQYFAGTTDEEGFKTYCTSIGIAGWKRLAAEKAQLYAERADQGSLTPISDTLAYIAWLRQRGVPLALVTGSLRTETQLVLEAFRLSSVFAAVVTAEDITHSKPHPEGYLKAAAALAARPERCIVVEDAPHGIQAANAAGMRCIALTTTYPRQALTLADVITERLTPAVVRL